MRRLLALAVPLALLVLVGGAHAAKEPAFDLGGGTGGVEGGSARTTTGGPYGWTISTSNTDPYANTGVATNGLRTVYLWFVCSTEEPNGPGGMASATFKINSTNISHAATIPQNNFLNAGTTNDLLLAVGQCPTGPVIAANLLIIDIAGGSMCLGPSDIKSGLIGTVDCSPAPSLFPIEWIGYSNTAGTPCNKGTATCVPSGPLVDAGPDLDACVDTPIQIGGDPTAQGGTSPYTFAWSPTTNLDDPTIANPTATPTSPGTITYTVTVTDSDGNSGTDSMDLTANANPVASIAQSDTLICEGDSVELTASGSGGFPGYSFSWEPATGLTNPNIASPTATPASTTTYTVTVTDQNGCSDTASITITVSTGLTADAGADAKIDAGGSTTIGGTPSGGTEPYTFSWSPTTGLDDPTFQNPTVTSSTPGTTTYTVTVTDAAGCTAMDSMDLTVNDVGGPLVASAGADDAICSGGSTTIGGNPTASGGTSPYTFSWSPTTGLDDATSANPTASPTATTTYTVTVTDNAGDMASDSMTLTVNENPTADAGADATICSGAETTIGGNPTGSGGTAPYTFSWSPSSGLSSSSAANPTASPSSTTTYTVTVTDANGCEGTDQVTVTVGGGPTADAGPNLSIMPGGMTTIGGSPTGSGGTPPLSFSWSPTTGLSDPSAANPTAMPTSTTTYTVTVTDANGCEDTDSMILTVSIGGEQPTTVDIRPGLCPNRFRLESPNDLKAAIVGRVTFDVMTVDTTTIRLEGVAPRSIKYRDVATVFDPAVDCECTEEDGDDLMDLKVKFVRSEIIEAAGLAGLEPGTERVLTLTANLLDGTPLELTDCIIIHEDDEDDDGDTDTDGDDDNDTDDGGDDDGDTDGDDDGDTDGDDDGDTDGDDDGDTDGDQDRQGNDDLVSSGGSGGGGDGKDTPNLNLSRGGNGFGGLGDADFRLFGAGPNPVSTRTTIRFALRDAQQVRLTVYDVQGREVETLVDGVKSSGEHSIDWDATGRPSGVYFYRIQAGPWAETRKVIVAR